MTDMASLRGKVALVAGGSRAALAALGLSVALHASSAQELPRHMVEVIESGRMPLNAYIEIVIGCTATYRIAALTRIADGRTTEATRFEERAREAHAAAVYLVKQRRAAAFLGPETDDALGDEIDIRVEARMERMQQSIVDPDADAVRRFQASVKVCDESGDLWDLAEAINRTTEW